MSEPEGFQGTIASKEGQPVDVGPGYGQQQQGASSSEERRSSGDKFRDKASNIGRMASSGMSNVGAQTGEAFGVANQNMRIGFGRTKLWFKSKISKSQAETPEDPDFLANLVRFHTTEKELNDVAKKARSLVRAQRELERCKFEMAAALSVIGTSGSGSLSTTSSQMGEVSRVLQTHANDFTGSFEADVVAPIDALLTGDIKNTGNLEREYKIAKLDFDSAQSTASGLASTPGPKHDNAQVKLQSASDNYETVKRRVRDAIERIENNKNNDVNQKWTQHLKDQMNFHEKCYKYLSDVSAGWS